VAGGWRTNDERARTSVPHVTREVGPGGVLAPTLLGWRVLLLLPPQKTSRPLRFGSHCGSGPHVAASLAATPRSRAAAAADGGGRTTGVPVQRSAETVRLAVAVTRGP
jgi:hypothetical protein